MGYDRTPIKIWLKTWRWSLGSPSCYRFGRLLNHPNRFGLQFAAKWWRGETSNFSGLVMFSVYCWVDPYRIDTSRCALCKRLTPIQICHGEAPKSMPQFWRCPILFTPLIHKIHISGLVVKAIPVRIMDLLGACHPFFNQLVGQGPSIWEDRGALTK